MKRRCISVAGLLLILLLPAAAGAKGRFERVTIAEEGSTVETLVTDEALLDFFAFSEFPKQVLAQAPRPTTKAYVVTRGGFTPDGVYHAFDRLHYYPAASSGHSGFVYYDGLVSGWSEYDHKWYAASAEGDRAMSRFIASRSPSAVGLPPNPGASSGRAGWTRPADKKDEVFLFNVYRAGGEALPRALDGCEFLGSVSATVPEIETSQSIGIFNPGVLLPTIKVRAARKSANTVVVSFAPGPSEHGRRTLRGTAFRCGNQSLPPELGEPLR